METEAAIIINIDKICRVCLQEKEDAVSIHSHMGKNSTDQNTVRVSEAIMKISDMKINADDGLPQIICRNCVATAFIANNFQLMCNRSSSLLQEYLKKVNNSCKQEPIEEHEEEGEIDFVTNLIKEESIDEEYSHNSEIMINENVNSTEYFYNYHNNNNPANINSVASGESCTTDLSMVKNEEWGINDEEMPNLYPITITEDSRRENDVMPNLIAVLQVNENNNIEAAQVHENINNQVDAITELGINNNKKRDVTANLMNNNGDNQRKKLMVDISNLSENSLIDKNNDCSSAIDKSDINKTPTKDSVIKNNMFKCQYCFHDVKMRIFSTHMRRYHMNQKEVADIYSFPKDSKERRKALLSLRERFNATKKLSQCQYCDGCFAINCINKHMAACRAKKKEEVQKIDKVVLDKNVRREVIHPDKERHLQICRINKEIIIPEANKKKKLENDIKDEPEDKDEIKINHPLKKNFWSYEELKLFKNEFGKYLIMKSVYPSTKEFKNYLEKNGIKRKVEHLRSKLQYMKLRYVNKNKR